MTNINRTFRYTDLIATSSGRAPYFPQFVGGDGDGTTLILLNTPSDVETGKLAFFANDGKPLVVGSGDGSSGSTHNYTIRPGGVFHFQTAGAAESTTAGWVRVTPDAGNTVPVGAGVFSCPQAGVLVTESGIPAAIPTTRACILVDQSGNRATGLAIANPSDAEISVTYRAFESDGSTTAVAAGPPQILKWSEQVVQYLSQTISGLRREFSGVLEISSASPSVALTLQSITNSRGHVLLTTFPVAEATRPAPARIVFPQIADGVGYLTRFLLIAPNAASSATLSFLDDHGSPLVVGSSKGPVKF